MISLDNLFIMLSHFANNVVLLFSDLASSLLWLQSLRLYLHIKTPHTSQLPCIAHLKDDHSITRVNLLTNDYFNSKFCFQDYITPIQV